MASSITVTVTIIINITNHINIVITVNPTKVSANLTCDIPSMAP